MKTTNLVVIFAITSNAVAYSSNVVSLFPRAPTKESETWSTSHRHGFRGTRLKPDKTASPDRSPSPKSPVEVRASAEGPVGIKIQNTGRSLSNTKEYWVNHGESLEKVWRDPRKLKFSAAPQGTGRVNFQSTGSKVYAGHYGVAGRGKVQTFGPDAEVRSGKLSLWEDRSPTISNDHTPNTWVSPPSPGALQYRYTSTHVRNSSSEGAVGAIGMAEGVPGVNDIQSLKTVVSNSPSHSPPPSSGRVLPQSPRYKYT